MFPCYRCGFLEPRTSVFPFLTENILAFWANPKQMYFFCTSTFLFPRVSLPLLFSCIQTRTIFFFSPQSKKTPKPQAFWPPAQHRASSLTRNTALLIFQPNKQTPGCWAPACMGEDYAQVCWAQPASRAALRDSTSCNPQGPLHKPSCSARAVMGKEDECQLLNTLWDSSADTSSQLIRREQ